MDRQPVKSSNIKSVGYDAATQVLEVEFPSGVYRYQDVTSKELHDLMAAEGMGSHFAAHIRGKKQHTKVSE